MPHELAIAILHTAEKKSSVGEQATVQKKTPPGPPAGTRQWHRRWKGSLILGVGRHRISYPPLPWSTVSSLLQ